MRINDRSPTGRRLQTIFIPAEPRPVMPTEVSDEIVLIHPAIPPMVGFKEGQIFFETVLGAAGADEVVTSLTPTDRYRWVQFLHVAHTDTTDRFVRIAIRDTGPNDVIIEQSQVVLSASTPLVLSRPIIVPNDMQLVATVAGILAPFVVRVSFFFYQLLHAEVNPTA